jgi:hypothetical protein
VDRPLQQTALVDLIAFAVMMIEHPAAFLGRRVALASDELSAIESAAALSRVFARRFRAEHVPAEELSPPLRALFSWLEETSHAVDLEAVRSRYPELGWHRYEDWARRQRSRVAGLCPEGADIAH